MSYLSTVIFFNIVSFNKRFFDERCSVGPRRVEQVGFVSSTSAAPPSAPFDFLPHSRHTFG